MYSTEYGLLLVLLLVRMESCRLVAQYPRSLPDSALSFLVFCLLFGVRGWVAYEMRGEGDPKEELCVSSVHWTDKCVSRLSVPRPGRP